MIKVTHALRVELNISDRSSTNNSEESISKESESEEKVENNNRKSKKRKTLHWTKRNFVTPAADFGDNLSPPPDNDELEPIDYCHFMFGKQSISLLTNQSNLYSVQKDPNKPSNVFFWSSTTRVECISSVMSRDRFLEIKKYLHVADNSVQLDRDDPNFDRAHKVRPLLNIIKENFRTISKEEKLSVDEQIKPFKGRSIMKQHMPNKPNRWGYKMFLLAGGESGICYDFVFYTGKGNKQEHGFCTDIVLDLCETVPRFINHKLYFDNYFTTIRLQVELKKLGIFSVGTVRPNRLLYLTMKTAKDLSSNGREAMDHRVTEVEGVELCVTRWYDNNVVNYLSTLHGCQPIDSVQRWSSKEKTHVLIARPNVIKAYNEHMGGVDLVDMLISLYRINVRSKKYYIKIIFHLIDLSVVNAWLLYRRHCSQLKLPQKNVMFLLSFRINVASILLKSSPPSPPIIKRGRPSLESRAKLNENQSTNTLRTAPTPIPHSSTRFDKFDHWPITTSKGRCRD
ncbi:unnamed protein product [Rotaria socialis]|uniref:PiggyBac transposable element-derived protein domain-containing protein n=3 Tax=Rotaria socialis TaxID=392032 RepID=A0A818YRB8_9BILA|nr:unnamed protein product [Rotaria socialis]CAF4600567.1 unnamed protein product [Rotaria socialis]